MSFNAINAQQNNYVFRHLDQHDGLAHNNVFDITQDRRGFIWLLTANGLQRYDGLRFVNYSEIFNISNDLNNDAGLYADSSNTIWIPKVTEVQKLQTTKNLFSSYQPEKVLQSAGLKTDTFIDPHNRKIFLSPHGSFMYDAPGKKYKWLTLNLNAFTQRKTNFFNVDKATGNIYSLADDGLILYDRQTKKIYSASCDPGHIPVINVFKQKLRPGDGRLVMIDSHNNLWVTTWGGLFYKYEPGTKKLYTYSLGAINQTSIDKNDISIKSPASVSCLFEDDHGTIWASTNYDGLLRYDAAKNNFEPVSFGEKNKSFNFQVYCIFQDKDENIWLGTDDGITIFNPYRQYFQSVHHEEGNASMLKSEIQSFIQTSTGDMLIGSWGGGIGVYDSDWNFKKNIIDNSPSYESNLVWSFVQNDDGTMWVGCQHGYIHIYNSTTGKIINTIHPVALDNSTIWCMTKDNAGNIWLGLHNGKIAEWKKSDQKFCASTDKPDLSAHVHNIFIDSHKRTWACTPSGLKEFDAAAMHFSKTYLPVANDTTSISSKNIEAIEQYNDSTLIIGTAQGGMNFFNINTGKFIHFNTKNGFPSNTIHSIKIDADGFVWFTTDYGLYKYKPSEKKFTVYNIERGIINSAFIASPLCTLKNGDWCGCTSTEVIYFNPKVLSAQNNSTTPVEIAGMRIFDTPLPVDSFLAIRKSVVLNYKQNFLTIEFASLNFSSIVQTKYYYKLSGVNNDWMNAGIRRSATYTNLQPGDYTFTVKADNGNAVSKETSFEIIIEPPFWKTTWFIVLCLILVAAIIYFLIQRRIKTIRSKAELKQKIAETEMIALRAQMNPHFIFNCLNSIDNLIQTNEKEKATTYLAKFAKLIRAILENSGTNSIACWKDLETLKLYLELEELRWGKKISYRLNIAPEILQGDYKVPPMIIQPYVENAIHHGLLNKEQGRGELLIDVKTEKNQIIYAIEDNGIGRKKAMEYKLLNKPAHQSMGLDITKERINLFNQNNNGSVTIADLYNNNEAAGTRVTVSLIN
jgi:ligand-binding sensor domain-containing protein